MFNRSMQHVTFSMLKRRKVMSFILILFSGACVFFSIFLQNLVKNQQEKMEKMVEESVIQCILTDARGAHMDFLKMPDAYVRILKGRDREKGNVIDEYVKNIRAKASEDLEVPKDSKLVRIHSLDSDSKLVEQKDAYELFEGVDESIFQSEEQVCMVSPDLEEKIYESEDNQFFDIERKDGTKLSLKVIGIVHKAGENIIYCPLLLQEEEGLSKLLWVDSCSFEVKNNRKLEETKKVLLETFVTPNLANEIDIYHYGVLVQDETYRKTLEELKSNLQMIKFLIWVLGLLSVVIGFFCGFMTNRTRIREFAVMRCLGMKRIKVFWNTMSGYFVLAIIGMVIGLVAGLILEGGIQGSTIIIALLMDGIFLLGNGVSIYRITNVDVFKLMRIEE